MESHPIECFGVGTVNTSFFLSAFTEKNFFGVVYPRLLAPFPKVNTDCSVPYNVSKKTTLKKQSVCCPKK
jgi:hypothetical protein